MTTNKRVPQVGSSDDQRERESNRLNCAPSFSLSSFPHHIGSVAGGHCLRVIALTRAPTRATNGRPTGIRWLDTTDQDETQEAAASWTRPSKLQLHRRLQTALKPLTVSWPLNNLFPSLSPTSLSHTGKVSQLVARLVRPSRLPRFASQWLWQDNHRVLLISELQSTGQRSHPSLLVFYLLWMAFKPLSPSFYFSLPSRHRVIRMFSYFLHSLKTPPSSSSILTYPKMFCLFGFRPWSHCPSDLRTRPSFAVFIFALFKFINF